MVCHQIYPHVPSINENFGANRDVLIHPEVLNPELSQSSPTDLTCIPAGNCTDGPSPGISAIPAVSQHFATIVTTMYPPAPAAGSHRRTLAFGHRTGGSMTLVIMQEAVR